MASMESQTPHFSVDQNQTHVLLKILLPGIRTEDVETHTHLANFTLRAPPFFLRLTLPGPVEEDDAASADYDPLSGALVVRLTKLVQGIWDGLDNLEKMLGGPWKEGVKGGREQDVVAKVGDTTAKSELEMEREILLNAERNNWRLPQTLPSSMSTTTPAVADATTGPPSTAFAIPNLATAKTPRGPEVHPYGFLDQYSGNQAVLATNDLYVLGKHAETMTPAQRFEAGERAVDEKFDPGHYQADYVYDEDITEIIRFKVPSTEELEQRRQAAASDAETDEMYFSLQEQAEISLLPKRIYPSSYPSTLPNALLILLFSTAYDTRSTLADPSPESPWTLTALNALFTSLTSHTSYPSPRDALRSSFRRALAFPLYRSWALAERVTLDVVEILDGGRRSVLRALLAMGRLLDGSEQFRWYRQLWVDDAATWVAGGGMSDAELGALARQVRETQLAKADIGWDLEDLETETRDAEGDVELD